MIRTDMRQGTERFDRGNDRDEKEGKERCMIEKERDERMVDC